MKILKIYIQYEYFLIKEYQFFAKLWSFENLNLGEQESIAPDDIIWGKSQV